MAKTRYVRWRRRTAYRPEGDKFPYPGLARLRQPGTTCRFCQDCRREGETRLYRFTLEGGEIRIEPLEDGAFMIAWSRVHRE